jgi:hypothetical protein
LGWTNNLGIYSPQLTGDLHAMDMDIKSLFASERLVAISTAYGYFSNNVHTRKQNATLWYHSPFGISARSFAPETEVCVLIPVVNRSTLLSSKHLLANFAFPTSKMHVHNTNWTCHNRSNTICSTASWIGKCHGPGRQILFRDGGREHVINEDGLVDGYQVTATSGSLPIRNKTGTR